LELVSLATRGFATPVAFCLGSAFPLGCSGDSEADRPVPADAQAEQDSAIWWLDAGTPQDADGSLIDGSFMPCGGEIQSGCDWTVPLAPNGKPAEPGYLSIRLRDSTGHETFLYQVSGPASCASNALAWYVDVPDGGSEVHLVACKATCDLIAASDQQVVILIGCVDLPP
jgi:hypothetical protein